MNKKISIIYNHFPHYRLGVFNEIIKKFSCVTFLGDCKDYNDIKSIGFDKLKNVHRSRVFNIGPFVYQIGIIKYVIKSNDDAYIFLANPYFISTWIASILCRLLGKNVIFWGHGFKNNSYSIKNIIRIFFFGIANSFYTYGYRAKLNAVSFGFNPDKIYVGFNSLNYDEQLSLRNFLISNANVRSPDNTLNIVCISRLTKICKYDLLFDALILFQSNYNIKTKTVVIGDGPILSSLMRKAEILKLDVEFIGELYDEPIIAKYLFDADVAVSPGKVGLTAMHSLNYGTPVISNNNFFNQMPEVESIVSGYTGYLFNNDSVEDLSNKLLLISLNLHKNSCIKSNCFKMIDYVYNPRNQVEILSLAINKFVAPRGDNAFILFNNSND